MQSGGCESQRGGGYASGTRRGYAYDLLAFLRWLAGHDRRLDQVDTPLILLEFLASCRSPRHLLGRRGRPSARCRAGGVGRGDGESAAGRGGRIVRVPGDARSERAEPDAQGPGGPADRSPASATGCWVIWPARSPARRLRVRQPRSLPRALASEEASALLESLRSWRDRAIAGLMLFSGLRSAEILALGVADVDIARGWARVAGKGGRERRVPVDAQVAGWIQTYLLAERPETTATALFVVAKGPHRGLPLTAAGLRTIFRYHRDKTGVTAGHPLSRPGARCRCCYRSVSPGRSPNPPCQFLGNGLSMVSAVRRGFGGGQGLGILLPR